MKNNTNPGSERDYYILPFSAKTSSALKNINNFFIKYLQENDNQIADISYTLCQDREHFDNRNFVVGSNKTEIIENLILPNDKDFTNIKNSRSRSVAFMFSGQGSQYLNMGYGLYSSYTVFKKYFDECSEIIKELLDEDIRDILFNKDINNAKATEKLSSTKHAQPCIFSLEYSLAKFWMELGVIPSVMVGHSVGEFVAACIAETISLEDALTLIVKRNELWKKAEGGGMLSIPRGHAAIESLLGEKLSIASINSPFLTIVSGPNDELEKLKEKIEEGGKLCSYLPASHAFHSSMMDPIIPEFRNMFSQVTLHKPKIPIMSTVTGNWLQDSEAMSPLHWANNVRKPVLFSQAIMKILDETNHTLLEVGPGSTLATLSKCHKDKISERLIITSLCHMTEDIPDNKIMLTSLGRLWANGVEINWNLLFDNHKHKRIALPRFKKRQNEEKSQIFSGSERETNIQQSYSLYPSEYLHQELINVWKETLMIDKIDTNANFYQLGGDSLLATSMVNKLKDRYGLLNISISDILDNPTIEKQEKIINQFRNKSKEIEEITSNNEFSRSERDEIINNWEKTLGFDKSEILDSDLAEMYGDIKIAPATPQQSIMWYLNQTDKDGNGYIVFKVYRLKGALKPGILEQSLNILFSSQKSFHTIFREKEGKLYQVILPSRKIELPVIDMKHLSIEEVLDKSNTQIKDFLTVQFDIGKWPLCRVCLMEFENQEFLFCLSKHHIITDWWSMGVMYKQLSGIYNSIISYNRYEYKELKMQYSDFSILREQELKNGKYVNQLNYWKNKITFTAEINIPYDYKRSEASKNPGNQLTLKVSQQLTGSIRNNCNTQEVSPYVFLLTAFGIFLQRLSGNKELNLGLAIAGRNNADIENVIGIVMNTIMARIDFEDESTFIECLHSIKNDMHKAYDNQDIPYAKVVEALYPSMTKDKNVLSRFYFDMLNYNDNSFSLNDVEIQSIDLENIESRPYCDFIIFITDKIETLELKFVYDADLFKKSTIDKMLQQYCHFLSQASADPAKRISEYSLRLPADNECLPDPEKYIDPALGDKSMINSIFDNKNNNIAFSDSNENMTFKEVDELSNMLASYFTDLGIKQGNIITIYADRSAVLILSIISIIKIDCVFSIINLENQPVNQISDQLQITKPNAGIFIKYKDEPLGDKWDELKDKTDISIELPGNKTALCEVVKNYAAVSYQNLKGTDNDCYINYTSGTTGKPKAVLGTMRPIANFISNHTKSFKLDATFRYAMLSGLTHDPLLRDVFVPMYLGAVLFIPDNNLVNSPKLAEWLDKFEINVINITPPLARILTNNIEEPVKSVKYIFCGGDRLDGELVIKMKKKFPNSRIINCYGTTETPQIMSYYEIPENYFIDYEKGKTGNIYIGSGTQTSQLLIFKNNQLAGVGEIGEIWIRTPYLSKGYYNDEYNTAKNYISNPFTNNSHDRIYKTGDLGRYTAEGNIEFIGRRDRQVKVRDHRIEPGEIEIALRQYPFVEDSAVIAIDDENGEKVLYAFYVSSENISSLNIKEFLRKKIPWYMIPSNIFKIYSIPLNQNGKVNYEFLKNTKKEKETELHSVA